MARISKEKYFCKLSKLLIFFEKEKTPKRNKKTLKYHFMLASIKEQENKTTISKNILSHCTFFNQILLLKNFKTVLLHFFLDFLTCD